MSQDTETVVDTTDNGKPDIKNRRYKARKSQGPLHDLLTEKLPHFRHPVYGVCDLYKLARVRGMTFQGVYKWFRPNQKNRLPVGQVDFLIGLSEQYKNESGDESFVPLTRDDLWPYVANG